MTREEHREKVLRLAVSVPARFGCATGESANGWVGDC